MIRLEIGNPKTWKSTDTKMIIGVYAPGASKAIQIVAANRQRSQCAINIINGVGIYVGPPSVTAATGFAVPGTETHYIYHGQDALYAITASGTAEVTTLDESFY